MSSQDIESDPWASQRRDATHAETGPNEGIRPQTEDSLRQDSSHNLENVRQRQATERLDYPESSSRNDSTSRERQIRFQSQATPIANEKSGADSLPAGQIAGMRERIRRFAPSWYSVTMGTGIIATLVTLLPWDSTHDAMQYIGLIYLSLDIVVFVVFNVLTVLRFTLYPYIFALMLKHPQYSLFLGTYPMSLTTIVSNLPLYMSFGASEGVVYAASGLWFASSVIGLATALVIPYVMITKHEISISGLTAAWLLPVVPPITAAAAGAVFAEAFTQQHPSYALVILVFSYVQLGVGLSLAFMVLVLYFYRLAVHNLPPSEVIVSVFLPLGPTGQGGYAFLRLGRVAQTLLPIISSPDFTSSTSVQALGGAVGDSMYAIGIINALLGFGFGCWWLFIALVSFFGRVIYYEDEDLDQHFDPNPRPSLRSFDQGATHRTGRSPTPLSVKAFRLPSRSPRRRSRTRPHFRIPLNLGWWGFVFPLGSLTLCTLALGDTFDSTTFNCIGTVMTISCALLWVVCIVPTVRGAILGRTSVWAAPCLTDLPTSA